MEVLAFILGVIFWTFLEYILHRYLGHVHRGKNFFNAEHRQHHAQVHYFAPAWKKLLASLLVTIFLILILSLLIPFRFSVVFNFGLVSMYALYEITHKRFHSSMPLSKAFLPLRKHHFFHHFHDPRFNHGVTTRFWDRVFGTFKEVDFVQIPRNKQMSWLCSENGVKSGFQHHFRIRK